MLLTNLYLLHTKLICKSSSFVRKLTENMLLVYLMKNLDTSPSELFSTLLTFPLFAKYYLFIVRHSFGKFIMGLETFT